MIHRSWLGSLVRTGTRAGLVWRYFAPRLKIGARWIVQSREVTNFTYDVTARNKLHLAHAIALATGASAAEVRRLFGELEVDGDLRAVISSRVRASDLGYAADERMDYGRRLGWYAAARVLKPGVVVETGVDKGLGSVVLCAALLRNGVEGSPGRYYGTDFNPNAGYLLEPPYSTVGEILYGDSLASLARFRQPIDLFINDSDHSAEYEGKEYECIKTKLSAHALILGDNAHVTDELLRFSEAQGRRFLFFKEEPKGHWYPGGGLGISFR